MSFFYVKIYYGPCDSFDTVAHKPQKLRGLKDRLQKLGFRVDLAPVDFINYCMIEMCGHEVFRCNIQNLLFNTPYNRDPVCKRAIAAVIESSAKFTSARSYLWCWTYIENQMFVRSEYSPKDYWPFDLQMKNFSTCMECLNCCGILANRRKVDGSPDGNLSPQIVNIRDP